MSVCLVAPIFVAAINSHVPKWLRWHAAAGAALATLTFRIDCFGAQVHPTFCYCVCSRRNGLSCATWKITFKKVE
jgi:hypothetical protein